MSLMINRGGTNEERERIVQSIIDRQTLIQEPNSVYPILGVFAEGTTTNGSALLPFKRGAFEGMRPVVPSFVTYDCGGQVRPTYDCLPMPLLSLLIFSSLQFNTVTLNIMPEFRPNKVMLSKHSDKSGENWKIYAECVREAIAKQSNLALENRNSHKEKQDYVNVMSGK